MASDHRHTLRPKMLSSSASSCSFVQLPLLARDEILQMSIFITLLFPVCLNLPMYSVSRGPFQVSAVIWPHGTKTLKGGVLVLGSFVTRQ
ncbi:hypothetical protein BJX64DRAFT_249123 [Aspergillus heterothallicus]